MSAGSWSRPGSAAARSDVELRTTYSFTDDGLTKDVTDPKGIVHRTEYDAARRKTATFANYVNGTPSSATADDDQTIRYAYTSGLMVTMTADLVSPDADQVTTYTYGVSRGSLPDSKVASNRLLLKVQYPDSSDANNDVVRYAYNAQGQQIYTKQQVGPGSTYNAIETDYDTAGRETHRRATSFMTGTDNLIKRISTTYLSRGLVDKVTQYDHATPNSGTAKDQVQYAYDGWGNVTTFTQDPDSAISGGSGRASFAVSYGWAASTHSDGVNTLRMTTQTLPSGFGLNNSYGTTNGLDDKMSRVVSMNSFGVTTLATYSYLGAAHLVNTVYDEPAVETGVFNSSATTYPDWDEFNRIHISDWYRVGITDTASAYFDARLTYDRNSNITRSDEPLYVKVSSSKRIFDIRYANDNLNRLQNGEQGHWSGSAITDDTFYESWELGQTGNWGRHRLNVNGDGDYTDANELDDTGTFNAANEYLTRDKDTTGGAEDTLTHDVLGNLTDDDEFYEYYYDAFGRLTSVKNQGSGTLIAEYRYNGLGYRTGWHYDTDTDGTVESGSPGHDPWYWFCYDLKWRVVATFRYTDDYPKERFIHNNAGLNGAGGSSYIDSVIFRDDETTAFNAEADEFTTRRHYLLQNWRADVVAVVNDIGDPVEYIRYSPYGIPTSYPVADINRDGVVNSTDNTDWNGGTTQNSCVVHIDLNKDSLYPDTTDFDFFTAEYASGKNGGYNKQSSVALRLGYAAYQWDPSLKMDHVRHRVYSPELGRWLTRDPAGYVNGKGLTQYVSSRPIRQQDPSGLAAVPCPLGLGCGASRPPEVPPDYVDCPPGYIYDIYTNTCVPVHGPPPPPPPPPPMTPCDTFCAANPGKGGGVICVNQEPVVCVCRSNPTFGVPDSDQRECIRVHEEKNKEVANCKDVGDGGRPAGVSACNEVEAYRGQIECIHNRMNCDAINDAREKCRCEAWRDGYIESLRCVQEYWRSNCNRQGDPPTERNLGYCIRMGKNIQDGKLRNCN